MSGVGESLIFQRQTIFGDGGDCLRAAVATIMGRPLESVIEAVNGTPDESIWFERLQEWLASEGWEIEALAPDDLPCGYAIAVGRPARPTNELHAVVVLDCEPVFDPHPSDAGLKSVKYFLTLTHKGPRNDAG